MVKIRLSRTGAKRRPFYHIVVMDERKRRDGACLERLGYFNPVANGAETELQLDLTRVNYWLSVGAKPTERVESLIKQAKKCREAPTTSA